VVSEGHSVLVFCSSRKGCETSARHIAKHLPPFTVIKKNTNGPADGAAAVEELRRCSAGLDPVLADTLPAGIAYHHAGLTVRPLLLDFVWRFTAFFCKAMLRKVHINHMKFERSVIEKFVNGITTCILIESCYMIYGKQLTLVTPPFESG